MATVKGIKQQLAELKKAKKNESGAVIYIRIDARIRDALHEQLEKDGLTYKDLLTAAISEYLGRDVTKEV